MRFHLGLLLVWMGQIDDARRQFRLARDAEPGSIPAKQAANFSEGCRRRRVVRHARRVRLQRSQRRPRAPSDEDAEFDAPATIEAIGDAIAAHGHDVGLEADATLPAAPAANVDVVFNIAEGRASRSRESQVPALLDLLGIPYTGSDAVALGVTLDKSLASASCGRAGWRRRSVVMTAGDDPYPRLPLPAIVAAARGSSKGSRRVRRVRRRQVRELARA